MQQAIVEFCLNTHKYIHIYLRKHFEDEIITSKLINIHERHAHAIEHERVLSCYKAI